MVTEVEVFTAKVVTLKTPVVAPAGIVTLAGTVATVVSLLKRMRAPPPGAGALRSTLPVEGDPPLTLTGFSLSEMRDGTGGCGVTLSEALWVTPA